MIIDKIALGSLSMLGGRIERRPASRKQDKIVEYDFANNVMQRWQDTQFSLKYARK